MQKYLVIYEKTSDGYSAYVPDLLGCVASGSTKTEVRQHIHEAIEFHLEGMILEGETPPSMQTEAEMMEFA
jgi:predicted RNase H-like HicB family nuclease